MGLHYRGCGICRVMGSTAQSACTPFELLLKCKCRLMASLETSMRYSQQAALTRQDAVGQWQVNL